MSPHELVVFRLCNVEGFCKKGFNEKLKKYCVRDLSIDNEEFDYPFSTVVPDAYKFPTPSEGEPMKVMVAEVEDSSLLTEDKIYRYYNIWEMLDSEGVNFDVLIYNRYGRHTDTLSNEYFENIQLEENCEEQLSHSTGIEANYRVHNQTD